MAHYTFPEIVCLDGRWFLQHVSNIMQLPKSPILENVWKATSMLLDIYNDDCGANLDRCVDFYNQAKNIFAGVSQLCQDAARELQEQIDLGNLYLDDDPNEPWYQK